LTLSAVESIGGAAVIILIYLPKLWQLQSVRAVQ